MCLLQNNMLVKLGYGRMPWQMATYLLEHEYEIMLAKFLWGLGIDPWVVVSYFGFKISIRRTCAVVELRLIGLVQVNIGVLTSLQIGITRFP